MKRFISDVANGWVNVVKRHKIISALLSVVLLGAFFACAPAKYAAADNNVAPTNVTWVNHAYLQSGNNQIFYDSDAFDTTYQYVQMDGGTCPNKIDFSGSKGDYGTTEANAMFFYQPSSDYYNSFDYTISYNGSITLDSLGNTGDCMYADSIKGKASELLNTSYRKYTFYREDNKIYNVFSATSFTYASTWNGIEIFGRDDETGDDCQDALVSHSAQAGGDKAREIFEGPEISGSSILYSVINRDSISGSKVTSQSYKIISQKNNIDYNTCVLDKDQIYYKASGTFPLIYGDGGTDWEYVSSTGLDESGDTNLEAEYDGGLISEDAFIVFVGTIYGNVPTDADGNPITTAATTTTTEDETEEDTCEAGAMGWIICPILEKVQSLIDLIRQALESLLTVDPVSLDTTSAMFTIWDRIRNLANVAFILIFFIIIFSQATSVGISNYGIKRLLPRLVVIAVAANVSYYICAFAIDIFNVLGAGVYGLVANAGGATSIDVSTGSAAIFTGGVATLAAAGTALAFTTAAGELFALVVVALISIIVVLITLFLRQAIIILLIVISPVAFIAGLLPGTQSWLNKWADLFITLLALYPLIMLIFAVAKLASSIILSTSFITPGGLF